MGGGGDLPFSLPIVYCDDYWLVVNKPAGLLVHPGADKTQPHMLEYLPADVVAASPKLVLQHRLDKETSGVVLLTRTPEECVRVAQLFEQHALEKIYCCKSSAYPVHRKQQVFSIDLALGQRKGRVWIEAQGQLARTEFEHLGRGWLLARPITGRKHQIRVHLAQAGWPIDGDPLYRGRAASRLMLHAWKLKISHPDRGLITLEAPLPSEFTLH